MAVGNDQTRSEILRLAQNDIYETAFRNLRACFVFDLAVAHLHRLIALHIITKFPA
jgi:hypothetical protein